MDLEQPSRIAIGSSTERATGRRRLRKDSICISICQRVSHELDMYPYTARELPAPVPVHGFCLSKSVLRHHHPYSARLQTEKARGIYQMQRRLHPEQCCHVTFLPTYIPFSQQTPTASVMSIVSQYHRSQSGVPFIPCTAPRICASMFF